MIRSLTVLRLPTLRLFSTAAPAELQTILPTTEGLTKRQFWWLQLQPAARFALSQQIVLQFVSSSGSRGPADFRVLLFWSIQSPEVG